MEDKFKSNLVLFLNFIVFVFGDSDNCIYFLCG